MPQDLIIKQPSTLVEFEPDEEWEISTGKEIFIISGSQAQELKKATAAGLRGLVWFDGFSISIAHIVFIKRVKKGSKTIENMKQQLEERISV